MKDTRYLQVPWSSFSPIEGRIYLNSPSSAPPILISNTVAKPEKPIVPATTHTPTVPATALSTGEAGPFILEAYQRLDLNDFAGARALLTKGISAEPTSAQ